MKLYQILWFANKLLIHRYFSQEAKLQREAACDQAVVLSAGGTREYAQTLLAFSKRTRGLGDSNKHKLDLAIAGSE